MSPLQLLYAKNVLCRRGERWQQELGFAAAVANLAYHKHVAVIWAGEEGRWHTLPAAYVGKAGQGYELWEARAVFPLLAASPIPGDIQFRLQAEQAGQAFGDPADGRMHEIHADAGVRLADHFPLRHVDYQPVLSPGQTSHPLTIVAGSELHPERMSIRWTTDHWESYAETPAFFRRRHWPREVGSHACNPNRYGCAVWISELHLGEAYRVEYAVVSAGGGRTCWDNNFGANYLARHAPLRVMTLNLHCYQEAQQDEKFVQIARAIRELQLDVVCLQEVGEPWNEGRGDWNGNAAKIIADRVGEPFSVHADWGHLGFGQYREGTAILSRYPFRSTDARYVSTNRDVYSIHARKVVMGQVAVPYFGLVNVFSTHLSWWEKGFREQFENLHLWAESRHTGEVAATLLCGDFNNPVRSPGYTLFTQAYEDQHGKANSPQPGAESDGRIDFILLKKGGSLDVTWSRRLFTSDDYGVVSDHPGFCAEFEPRDCLPPGVGTWQSSAARWRHYRAAETTS